MLLYVIIKQSLIVFLLYQVSYLILLNNAQYYKIPSLILVDQKILMTSYGNTLRILPTVNFMSNFQNTLFRITMLYILIWFSLLPINLLIALPQHYYYYMHGTEEIRENYDKNFTFCDWFVYIRGEVLPEKESGSLHESTSVLFLALIISPILLYFNLKSLLPKWKFHIPSIPNLSLIFRKMHRRKFPEEYI